MKGLAKKEKVAAPTPLAELNPPPSFIQDRDVLWQKLKAKYEAEIAAKKPEPIKVTLPDGKELPGESWRTTPYDIAKSIRLVF